ncbi:MAG: 1-deoxy-D-xylulose-5-phosphate synthase [Coriobacteriales bacterium]|jgi:1-deoxy-D-xylulose-5-phosphate synthase|nr:1-deoxy-D-xylulose-5-phosphate synthase [Coriobacteriales bacterium]
MPDLHPDIPPSAALKALSSTELNELAAQIRSRLIEVTSVNGGHLASSLGAVELILALHRMHDFPTDRLVFDVGHQSYAHKLLTGRASRFDTLRTHGGLSGFTRFKESPFDAHDAGHASDSLSIALGLALARDLNGGSERVVALIGDAALSGGMAFEALNQIGQLGIDMTIVLNDNEMSISRNVGALSLYLGKARMSRPYTTLRNTVEERVSSAGRVGRMLMNAGETAKDSFKKLMVPGTFFEDMGIVYIGPIDGHNIDAVSEALRVAQKAPGPVLIHAVTQKGRGYAPAEQKPDVFHGVGCYDPDTGDFIETQRTNPTFTSVFSQALLAEARLDPAIVAITAAMTDGTGLAAFKAVFPARFYDVGIAEEHAVALAGGLALGGKLPVVAIYSTFLQRAFDQLIINVALQEQHVVFCVDRAGIVGEDGSTHHGLFDLAYLRPIPNLRIIAPANGEQLVDALHTALALDGGPIALRYPRGEAPAQRDGHKAGGVRADGDFVSGTSAGGVVVGGAASGGSLGSAVASGTAEREPQILPVGQAIKEREGKDVSLLAIGRMVDSALGAARLLAEQGIEAAVYNMLWVKPLDEEAVREAAAAPLVVTIEEGVVTGGFGTAVLEALGRQSLGVARPLTQVLTLGVPDTFVSHGSTEQLLKDLGLTAPQIAKRVSHVFKRKDQAR